MSSCDEMRNPASLKRTCVNVEETTLQCLLSLLYHLFALLCHASHRCRVRCQVGHLLASPLDQNSELGLETRAEGAGGADGKQGDTMILSEADKVVCIMYLLYVQAWCCRR